MTVMADRSRSSKMFCERAGLRATYRPPTPEYVAGNNPAHREPLDPPLPDPDLLGPTQGAPPPDRGVTTAWPPPAPTRG